MNVIVVGDNDFAARVCQEIINLGPGFQTFMETSIDGVLDTLQKKKIGAIVVAGNTSINTLAQQTKLLHINELSTDIPICFISETKKTQVREILDAMKQPDVLVINSTEDLTDRLRKLSKGDREALSV